MRVQIIVNAVMLILIVFTLFLVERFHHPPLVANMHKATEIMTQTGMPCVVIAYHGMSCDWEWEQRKMGKKDEL